MERPFSAEAEGSALRGPRTGEQILKHALVILELSVNRLVLSWALVLLSSGCKGLRNVKGFLADAARELR
jgi:hypothetical protein